MLGPDAESGSRTDSQISDLTISQTERQGSSSWVADHYSISEIDGKRKRICMALGCQQSYIFNASHVVLRRHWVKIHGESPVDDTIFTFSNHEHVDRLVKLVVIEQLEYSLVDKEAFKKFCKSLSHKKLLITRQTVSNLVIDKTSSLRSLVTSKMAKVMSVALTFDLWSATKNSAGFGCITAHFVDDLTLLQTLVLEFKNIPYPHDATKICEFLRRTIETFDIGRRVIAITTDNASNIKVGITLLEAQLNLSQNFGLKSVHFRCLAHIIHLGVSSAIKELDSLIKPARDFVSHVRSSRKRTEIFEAVQEKLFCEGEFSMHSRPLKLIDYVDTRWNSTFLMLRRVLQLRPAIAKTIETQVGFDKSIEIEWDALAVLLSFLRPFYELTERISAEKYPTVSSINVFVERIVSHLAKTTGNPRVDLCAAVISKKLDAYLVNLKCDVIEIAGWLDPRIKLSSLRPEQTKEGAKTRLRAYLDRDLDSLENSYSSTATRISDDSIFSDIYVHEANEDEVDRYFDAPREKADRVSLEFWKYNASKYPKLFSLAISLLPIQVLHQSGTFL